VVGAAGFEPTTVELLDGDERALRRLSGVDPGEVGIPLLVLAELLFGAEKSKRA